MCEGETHWFNRGMYLDSFEHCTHLSHSRTKRSYFTEEDVFAILSALKAILFLGNINFEPNETDGNASVDPATESWIAKAAEMLTVPRDRLANCLTSKVINVRGELMESPLTPSQSVDTRNALAKEMYGRLFCQIVAQANESLSPQAPVSENDTQFGPATQLADSRDLCIGLLDIFGFELLRWVWEIGCAYGGSGWLGVLYSHQ